MRRGKGSIQGFSVDHLIQTEYSKRPIHRTGEQLVGPLPERQALQETSGPAQQATPDMQTQTRTVTAALWPVKLFTCRFVRVSHTRTRLSRPPDARRLPASLTATASTPPVQNFLVSYLLPPLIITFFPVSTSPTTQSDLAAKRTNETESVGRRECVCA